MALVAPQGQDCSFFDTDKIMSLFLGARGLDWMGNSNITHNREKRFLLSLSSSSSSSSLSHTPLPPLPLLPPHSSIIIQRESTRIYRRFLCYLNGTTNKKKKILSAIPPSPIDMMHLHAPIPHTHKHPGHLVFVSFARIMKISI